MAAAEYEILPQPMRHHVGRDGALVEAITLNRRVVGSTPTLAVT